MKDWNAVKCIVSLTSYSDRLKLLPLVLRKIIELSEFHFVLTIYKGDQDRLTPQTKKWIDEGLLELFVDDIDYRYHKKYMHAMEKYGDRYPVIIIDDDNYYEPGLLLSLYDAHLIEPDYVIGTRGYIPVFDENLQPIHTSKWCFMHGPYTGDDVILFGAYGVIFPVGFKPIFDFPSWDFNDDFTLYASILRRGFHIKLIEHDRPKGINCDLILRTATYIPRWEANEDIYYFNYYKDVFMSSVNNESLRFSKSSEQ